MTISKQVTTRYVTEDGFALTFEPIDDSLQITETETEFEVKYLTQDPDPISPDDWGDDNLFLVHYHQDFHVLHDRIITKDDVRDWYQDRSIPQEETYRIFPVSALIHSGVWLQLGHGGFASDSGGWDTSHVGAILVSKSEWPAQENARKAASSLIEEWNSYLSGDVYGIIREIFTREKQQVDSDSVWGFVSRHYAEAELQTFGGAPCLSS